MRRAGGGGGSPLFLVMRRSGEAAAPAAGRRDVMAVAGGWGTGTSRSPVTTVSGGFASSVDDESLVVAVTVCTRVRLPATDVVASNVAMPIDVPFAPLDAATDVVVGPRESPSSFCLMSIWMRCESDSKGACRPLALVLVTPMAGREADAGGGAARPTAFTTGRAAMGCPCRLPAPMLATVKWFDRPAFS